MRGIGAATATLVLAASLASCGQSPTLPDSEVSTSAYAPTPVSNLTAAQEAEGFKDAGNGLAYRWTTTTGGCEYGHCTTMEVLAYHACSSVYAEVNVLNSAGAIVDMSNDTASNMSAGTRAEFTFTTFDDDAAKTQLTELNCN